MIPFLQARAPAFAAFNVAEVLASRQIGFGENVQAFERDLGKYLGASDVLCVNSCTSALVLATTMARHQRGGAPAMLTTPMTFVATTTSIYQAGCVPVWVDVESRWSCQMGIHIDVAMSQANVCQQDIAAIVAVAWGGWLPDLAKLSYLARKLGVPLIVDAAQAFGARYQAKPIHEWADFTCYSFSPTKHITCGDGGALVCRDPERAAELRRLSWFGMRRWTEGKERVASDQDIATAGFKFNMNEIAAAIGRAGLETVDEALARARAVAAQYWRALPLVRRDDERRDDTTPSPWFYTAYVDDPGIFIDYMADRGVTVCQPHRRNDAYSFAKKQSVPLPNTAAVQARYVALPVGWWLTDADVAHVIDAVHQYRGKVG